MASFVHGGTPVVAAFVRHRSIFTMERRLIVAINCGRYAAHAAHHRQTSARPLWWRSVPCRPLLPRLADTCADKRRENVRPAAEWKPATVLALVRACCPRVAALGFDDRSMIGWDRFGPLRN